MDWYYYIALAAIVSQFLVLFQTYCNCHFALDKYNRKCSQYRPRTVLIIPCKGLDSAFEGNITSFFGQGYENYLLWFVVADESDPAYGKLCELKNRLSQDSKARDVQVLVAGEGQSCGQKLHNLLHCYERISDDIEAMAFADSDICVRSNWLNQMIYPLRQSKNGVTSGYRWFVPTKNNLASLALSAMNANVAQFYGKWRFNQVWGGSMAIRVDVFRKLGVDKIWSKALTDDLSLSSAVKKTGMKVAFVPACLVASYECTTWRKLFEFGRRQFIITRVYGPRTWWLGLFGNLYSVLGIWGTTGLAIYFARIQDKNLPFLIAVPVLFFVSQMGRAILRQKVAHKLLERERQAMRVACAADILGFWLWSPLLLLLIVSSVFGRTIRWRGIRYKLLGPAETIVEADGKS